MAVQPYNTILTLSKLMDFTDLVFSYSNEQIGKLCNSQLQNNPIDYQAINRLIAKSMSGSSLSQRFPYQLNHDYKKIYNQLVLFPRLHFISTGLAPLISEEVKPYQATTPKKLIKCMLMPNSQLFKPMPKGGKLLVSYTNFQGDFSTSEIEQSFTLQRKKRQLQQRYQDWIKRADSYSISNVENTTQCSQFFSNATTFGHAIKEYVDQFKTLQKRKSFQHIYSGEGLTEKELSEMQTAVADLAEEYQQSEQSQSDNEEE